MRNPAISAITLLALLGTAHAIDTPQMKEGLWKLHVVGTSPGSAPTNTTYSICRDHAYDKRTEDLSKSMKECVISEESISGNKRTFLSTCKIAGTTITGKGSVTWTGDAAVRSETHTTYNPAFYGKTEETTIMEQSWTGACPAGMNPGDHMDSSGKIQHIGHK